MTAARGNHGARTAAIQVNEAAIWASNQGAGWWSAWRLRMEPAGRITVIIPSLGGDLVRVSCDSREDAAWLRDHLVRSGGVPGSAVKIVRGAS